MTSISASAASAREVARLEDGKFGIQRRMETLVGAGGVDLLGGGPPKWSQGAIERVRRVLHSNRERLADLISPPQAAPLRVWADAVRYAGQARSLKHAGADVDLDWLDSEFANDQGKDEQKALDFMLTYHRYLTTNDAEGMELLATRVQTRLAHAYRQRAALGDNPTDADRKVFFDLIRSAQRLDKTAWNAYKAETAKAVLDSHLRDFSSPQDTPERRKAEAIRASLKSPVGLAHAQGQEVLRSTVAPLAKGLAITGIGAATMYVTDGDGSTTLTVTSITALASGTVTDVTKVLGSLLLKRRRVRKATEKDPAYDMNLGWTPEQVRRSQERMHTLRERAANDSYGQPMREYYNASRWLASAAVIVAADVSRERRNRLAARIRPNNPGGTS